MFDLPVETFAVRFEADPFVLSAVRRDMPCGATIAEAIDALELNPEALAVGIGGHAIPRTLWGSVRPKPGAVVEVRVVPGAPVVAVVSTVVSAIGSAVAGAAAVVGSAASAVAATAVGKAIIGTAISYGIRTVANTIFGRNQGVSRAQASLTASRGSFSTGSFSASSSSSSASQLDTPRRFGITAASNQSRPYAPFPQVLGTHRMVPPYGSSPYTEIVGNDQYLRLIFLWGYGPVSLSDIRIGNTPIGNFSGVEIEHDETGTLDSLTLYPDTARQEELSIVLSTSYQQRTTPIETDEIGATVTFPSGLFEINDDGTRISRSVGLELQYRLVGAGSWTSWVSETITRAENAAVRVSWRVSVARGKYEVRVRRTSARSADTQVADNCVWTALRSFKNEDPVKLAGIAKTALRIKASDQLNGVVNELSALVSFKCPTWGGASWGGSSVTKNPAAIFRYVLLGAANKKAVDASRIDDANLGAWYEFCETNNLTYSTVIEEVELVQDLLSEIAAAGFASPKLNGDTWGVTIDKPRSTVVQHFTQRNSWGFSSEVVTADRPHALRVQFANENKDYRVDERVVYDDGYNVDNATKFEVIEFGGVTNPDQIYKLARHFIASARLRPERFVFRVDVENLVAERGDLVRLSHDVALIGQTAGRIKSIDGTDLTLDEFCTFESGKTYALRVRQSDGTTTDLTATFADGPGSTNVVTVNDATGLAAGDLWMFGESGEETIEALIYSISYEDDLVAEITCVPYSAEVYDAADTIPPYDPLISDPSSLSSAGPATPTITNVRSDEKVLQRTSQGDLQPAMVVDFLPGSIDNPNPFITPESGYRLRYRKTDAESFYTYIPLDGDARSATIPGVDQGQEYQIEVQAVDSSGRVSNWASWPSHTVVGFGTKPPDLDTFRLATIGDQTYVQWTYPSIAADVIGYEIRYHPDTDVTTWAYMTTLSDQIPRDAREFMVPSRSGSYAIKAIDLDGNKSELALFVNATLIDPLSVNTVQNITEHPAFTGTKTNVFVVSDNLQLDADTVMADWTTLADVGAMSRPTANDGFVLEGFYEFGETDLGAVYTSRIEANIDLRSVNFRDVMASWASLAALTTLAGAESGDEYAVEVQVAYSTVDSGTPSYGAWQTFAVADITARHVKFRAKLTTTDNQLSPTVNELSVVANMPNRIADAEDVVSGAGTKSITFSPAFRTLKSVTIAAQDMQTGDYYEIASKARTGFDVTFRDSGGAAVSRTFDWQAVGFGQERGT